MTDDKNHCYIIIERGPLTVRAPLTRKSADELLKQNLVIEKSGSGPLMLRRGDSNLPTYTFTEVEDIVLRVMFGVMEDANGAAP